MTQITTDVSSLLPYAKPVNAVPVAANNGLNGGDGTHAAGIQTAGEAHRAHHHGSGSANTHPESSFAALMNLLGSSTDDDATTESSVAVSSPLGNASSPTSLVPSNDVSNLASSSDSGASAVLQALHNYTMTGLTYSAYGSAINQSA